MSVVLVTGGSSGIGLATVRRLAASGHQVYCGSRNPSRAALPGGVTPVAVDVGDPESGRAAVRSVVAAAGRLDVLVNNAGTGGTGALEEIPDERAHDIFEVNLFGPMRLAAAAVPVMRARGGGRIINVTSANDTVPAPFGGWYSASKAALASASIVLDAEVHAFGIFVTVVAPGLFRTPMAQRLTDRPDVAGSRYAAELSALPDRAAASLEHAGDPDDVARAIEDCMASADPPTRIVVGADAEEMISMIGGAAPGEVAAVMRGHVAGLAPRRPAAGAS
jgi:NAD(P)-dependent dehydrogenase (short-subunit alcohol dehydrogenase family)